MPSSYQTHPAVKLLSSITYLESLDAVTLESVARTAVKRSHHKENNAVHQTKFHWVQKIAFGAGGPQPQPLLDNECVKMVLVELEPKQQIPPHPAPSAVHRLMRAAVK